MILLDMCLAPSFFVDVDCTASVSDLLVMQRTSIPSRTFVQDEETCKRHYCIFNKSFKVKGVAV